MKTKNLIMAAMVITIGLFTGCGQTSKAPTDVAEETPAVESTATDVNGESLLLLLFSQSMIGYVR